MCSFFFAGMAPSFFVSIVLFTPPAIYFVKSLALQHQNVVLIFQRLFSDTQLIVNLLRFSACLKSDLLSGPGKRIIINAFALPSDVQGAVVTNVEADSPAELGGLTPGDVIVSFGDKNISSAQQLRNRASLATATPVKLRILRHGKPLTLTITPEPLRDVEPVLVKRMALMLEGGPDDQPRPDGLKIVDIRNDSPFLYINAFSNRKGAGSSGLNRNEWLLELNGTVLDSIAVFRKTLAALDSGERVLLRVRGRNGELRFVTGILP